MAHEEALQSVNSLYGQLTGLVRTAINSIGNDNKIDASEAIQLGLQSFNIAGAVTGLVTRHEEAMLKDILFVLENGRWYLPE